MNNKTKLEKYRKLPIAALVTGILGFSIISFPPIQMWSSSYLNTDMERLIFNFTIGGILGIGLPIVAIVCGSIDLKRIKKGLHSSKVFKGMDIVGIVLGSVVILFVLISYWRSTCASLKSVFF